MVMFSDTCIKKYYSVTKLQTFFYIIFRHLYPCIHKINLIFIWHFFFLSKNCKIAQSQVPTSWKDVLTNLWYVYILLSLILELLGVKRLYVIIIKSLLFVIFFIIKNFKFKSSKTSFKFKTYCFFFFFLYYIACR